MAKQGNPLAAAKRDPVLFTETVLVDPETEKPFVLYAEQKRFLRAAFTLTPDGRFHSQRWCSLPPRSQARPRWRLGRYCTWSARLVVVGRKATALRMILNRHKAACLLPLPES